MQVYYDLSRDNKFSIDFIIELKDDCIPAAVTKLYEWTPKELTYIIGLSTTEHASFNANWTTEPALCLLLYSMSVVSVKQPTGSLITYLPGGT